MKSRLHIPLPALATACCALALLAGCAKKPPVDQSQFDKQALAQAALEGDATTIQAAIDQGYDVNGRDPDQRTLLLYAAYNGQTKLIKKLIQAGADVNARDTTGSTALMFAASAPNGRTALEALLDAGAKINAVDDNEHFTALMWAAAEGQTDNVKLLLAKGADASLRDIDGDTAESFAGKAGHTEIVQTLQE